VISLHVLELRIQARREVGARLFREKADEDTAN
jgi:hypothetical protein